MDLRVFFTNKKDGYQDSATDYARSLAKNKGGKERVVEAYLNAVKKQSVADSSYNFNDLKVITVDELAKIDNLSVILMLGNPWSVIDQLKKLGIKNIFHYNELSVARIMNTPFLRTTSV